MNKRTIKILNKYDKNIKMLDISNNKIVKLNNLHNNLTSYKIFYLTKIFMRLGETGVNCKKNLLQELCYPFNVKPKKYPSKITHLTLGYNFN